MNEEIEEEEKQNTKELLRKIDARLKEIELKVNSNNNILYFLVCVFIVFIFIEFLLWLT